MNTSGFTLIEVLVIITIIGILAAGAYLTLGTLLDKGRYDSTVETMNTLKTAIIGNSGVLANGIRTDFGYLNGMGRLPLTLQDLANQGTQPVYTSTTNCGWNGPYVKSKFQDDSDGYRRDGWGNLLQYNSVTGVITSYGSDGIAGGSGYAADIIREKGILKDGLSFVTKPISPTALLRKVREVLD